MASYNQEFNRMQEEALARLRDMQSRSRTAVNRPQPPPQQPPPTPPVHEHRPEQHQNHAQHQNHPQPQNHAPPQDFLKNVIGDMKIDSEKALILLMLFVLYKNKADAKLLLALGYLLI